MKQGEIWFVKYDPSVGHEFKKSRPAIIISSNQALQHSNLVTVMAITKNRDNCIDNDIKIKKDESNRLFTDSIIKVCHISSFDKERFIKKIGIVDNEIFNKIKQYIGKHFDI